MDLIRHLFSVQGFPVITKYGQSWEPWLIAVYVFSKGISACAYLLFAGVFLAFMRFWQQGRIDQLAAKTHIARVDFAFLTVCVFESAVQLGQIAGFWWPAYRILGLLVLASSLVTLVAAWTTLYSLTACLLPKGESP